MQIKIQIKTEYTTKNKKNKKKKKKKKKQERKNGIKASVSGVVVSKTFFLVLFCLCLQIIQKQSIHLYNSSAELTVTKIFVSTINSKKESSCAFLGI